MTERPAPTNSLVPKSGSTSNIGDAANWEAVLAYDFKGADLHLLSGDDDFSSNLEPSQLNEFLASEWQNRFPKSDLFYYRTIAQFTSTQFPEVKLSAEVDKLDAIDSLVNSTSFMRTHAAIAELARYAEFTENEVKRMVTAANNNGQIYRIVSDDDVGTFFRKLINGREHLCNPAELNLFKEKDEGDETDFF